MSEKTECEHYVVIVICPTLYGLFCKCIACEEIRQNSYLMNCGIRSMFLDKLNIQHIWQIRYHVFYMQS